ncbi:Gfo/Idh/MocA family protein [Mariniblastus fucicola]|uniref:Glucose--fructose oxidoreductase n=1 Tax=Mariniblastus fucicola TaxID=980251 RepID=A0A5B9PSH6_9BACT|nr:Gfo/Idh/MocA family oxidoreductase [Mariniblastus fucicola]QEG25183.1 Glucose--fructose oxidoreductase precursor [Mariniblastus fucicola]
MSQKMNRRHLLKSALAAMPVAAMLPGFHVGGSVRNRDTLRLAAVGIGGRGMADLNAMSSHKGFELNAVCDVDKTFFANGKKFNENVACFQDYRTMFDEKSDDFDAVLVATPDHMHSPITKMAIEAGKHVYLQKPLAQDIGECRLLADTAEAHPELVTQMGIQIHSHPAYRTAVKWIQSGLIGTVNEVHSWSGKGWGGEVTGTDPSDAPEHLDWDLYCGVSEKLAYVEGYYHRNNWRKWLAFGTGTQGDMGCHIVDPVFTALKLKRPTKVKSLGPKPFEKNFALISHVEYEFKGTDYTTDALKLSWYNGSMRPTKLEHLPDGVELPHQGSVFIGDKGSLILPHIAAPIVFDSEGNVVEKLPESVAAANHFHDWIDAALGEKEKATAHFQYAGPLTEAVLMGTVVNRWPNREFNWNADECRFSGDGTEVAEANALLRPAYRTGW